jgi:hypothetical protein
MSERRRNPGRGVSLVRVIEMDRTYILEATIQSVIDYFKEQLLFLCGLDESRVDLSD